MGFAGFHSKFNFLIKNFEFILLFSAKGFYSNKVQLLISLRQLLTKLYNKHQLICDIRDSIVMCPNLDPRRSLSCESDSRFNKKKQNCNFRDSQTLKIFITKQDCNFRNSWYQIKFYSIKIICWLLLICDFYEFRALNKVFYLFFCVK